ncbi:MAG: hypothetical protein EBU32_03175 [Opitutaceae bacterium]|jgi:hypothetical protein|nr:hypothetical protein [Opitutaceae bacterium]
MKSPAHSPRDLHESFFTRVLRDQPPRRAPAALESRVRAELARRATLPWWQQSYAFWPAPIRIAFLVASAVVAAALVVGASVFFQGPAHHFAARFAAQFSGVARAADGIVVSFSTALTLWRALPPLWVYGGLAILGTAYGLLIGVGAAAYRTINVPRF